MLVGDEAVLPGIAEGNAAPSARPHEDLDGEVGAREDHAPRLAGQVLGQQGLALGGGRAERGRVPQQVQGRRQARSAGHDVGQRRLGIAVGYVRPRRRNEHGGQAEGDDPRGPSSGDPGGNGRQVHEREPQRTEGDDRQAHVRDDVVCPAVDDVAEQGDAVARHPADRDEQRSGGGRAGRGVAAARARSPPRSPDRAPPPPAPARTTRSRRSSSRCRPAGTPAGC